MLIHVRDPHVRARARQCFQEDAERARLGQRMRRAIETDIYVTNVCNLRCSYCYFYFEDYFSAPSHHQPGNPSLERLQAIVDRISGRTYTLVLLGGEPFSRPDIGEFLAYVKSKDIFSARVSTNGMLLKRKKGVLPLVDTLTVSIDAMRIAQYPKQMARMLDDLVELRRELGPEMPRVVPSWTTGPDDDFDTDVKPLLDYSRENGFIVKFLPLKVDQKANWEKQRQITQAALDYAGPEHVTNQPGHTRQLADGYGGENCLIIGNQFYVDYDGNFLYPCDEYAFQKTGSLLEDDIDTLFERGVTMFGEFPIRGSICAQCPSGCHSDNSYIIRNPQRQLEWLG